MDHISKYIIYKLANFFTGIFTRENFFITFSMLPEPHIFFYFGLFKTESTKATKWPVRPAKTQPVHSPSLIRAFAVCRARWERGGSVVECRTPEREVRGSRPTAAVLCPWARHFTPRKYWLITQEAMAPSRHDWKIVDWDVKPQHNQPTAGHGSSIGCVWVWYARRLAQEQCG